MTNDTIKLSDEDKKIYGKLVERETRRVYLNSDIFSAK